MSTGRIFLARDAVARLLDALNELAAQLDGRRRVDRGSDSGRPPEPLPPDLEGDEYLLERRDRFRR